MKYKGMAFNEVKGGYKVSSDNGLFEQVIKDFSEAAMWISEMADNSDIGSEFCERICEKFGKDIG